MKELHKKLMSLPSNQFWIIVLGFMFMGFVISGALGPFGVLLTLLVFGYAGMLAGERIFSNEQCDKYGTGSTDDDNKGY